MSKNNNNLDLHAYYNEKIDPEILENIKGQKVGFTRPRLVKGDFCKYFCNKSKCKHCVWSPNLSADQSVIKGLYSSWITENIIAMARPNTKMLKDEHGMDEFRKAGIKTVINMEISGEHAHCGYGNDPNSGFSYDPCLFMNNGIDYLNYPCEDFHTISIHHLLDLVKCIQHRLTQGKVAVHCHAGLGRTGVAIGAYLVFNNRMDPEDAINYIREKRPNSIQNTVQVSQIIDFANYVKPMRTIFYIKDQSLFKFSMQEHILRQKNFIHGNEMYLFHHIPKIIFVCLMKISTLSCSKTKKRSPSNESILSSEASSANTIPTPSIRLKHFQRWTLKIKSHFENHLSTKRCQKIIKCLTTAYENPNEIITLKNLFNNSDGAWEELDKQDVKLHLVCQLLKDWLLDLKFPVLRIPDLEILKDVKLPDVSSTILKLESNVGRTLFLFLTFLNQFRSRGGGGDVFYQITSILFSLLTHKNTNILPLEIKMVDTNFQLTHSLADLHNEALRQLVTCE